MIYVHLGKAGSLQYSVYILNMYKGFPRANDRLSILGNMQINWKKKLRGRMTYLIPGPVLQLAKTILPAMVNTRKFKGVGLRLRTSDNLAR